MEEEIKVLEEEKAPLLENSLSPAIKRYHPKLIEIAKETIIRLNDLMRTGASVQGIINILLLTFRPHNKKLIMLAGGYSALAFCLLETLVQLTMKRNYPEKYKPYIRIWDAWPDILGQANFMIMLSMFLAIGTEEPENEVYIPDWIAEVIIAISFIVGAIATPGARLTLKQSMKKLANSCKKPTSSPESQEIEEIPPAEKPLAKKIFNRFMTTGSNIIEIGSITLGKISLMRAAIFIIQSLIGKAVHDPSVTKTNMFELFRWGGMTGYGFFFAGWTAARIAHPTKDDVASKDHEDKSIENYSDVLPPHQRKLPLEGILITLVLTYGLFETVRKMEEPHIWWVASSLSTSAFLVFILSCVRACVGWDEKLDESLVDEKHQPEKEEEEELISMPSTEKSGPLKASGKAEKEEEKEEEEKINRPIS